MENAEHVTGVRLSFGEPNAPPNTRILTPNIYSEIKDRNGLADDNEAPQNASIRILPAEV